ncbi:uncharacterized protein LOC120140205 [Hibiscus syriacus]|uniref:uncharacterized protein LOC120140205 n=1 Tax=Hibiscus syriacus TaxID=106335 RepID=UPI001923B4BA|nr:uncharacterized protein LOC120140205 [Hibiscus syriacus]
MVVTCHCNSVVHDSKPGDEKYNVMPFSGRQNGYFSGGDNVLNRSHMYYTPESKALDSRMCSSDSSDRGALDFDFHGFWSRTTGELCMVGSSDTYSDEGKLLHLATVLKINNLKSSSNINTLVTGTISSLNPANDPSYFNKISLLMFPQMNYGYTMASKQFSQGCPLGTDVQLKLSLSLSQTRTICDMLSGGDNAFELEYASGCGSSKSCCPFGDVIRYLPPAMSLRTWDAKSNRHCIAACRIYNASSSFDKSPVGDCTTRLSLRFPAVLSIRHTDTVVGEIWSLKKRNEAGFFNRIEFQNTGHHRGKIQLQGLKYEYTEMDRVKKSCPKKNPRTRSRRVQYPDGYSGDMGFSMSILNGSKVNIGWGSSDPLGAGNQSNQRFPYLIPSSSSKPKHPGVKSNSSSGLLNISYKMRISVPSWEVYPGLTPVNKSSNEYLETEFMISADGIYDNATGILCMVGCTRLMSGEKSFSSHSMDYEILVNVYFSPQDSNRRSKIKGSIESMCENTDPLYFEPMQFLGWAHYRHWISESIWRMNFEMIMSVISNTLSIIFVAFQIFHVRKHRGAGPLVSLLMLVILASGHLIPLVLNLEAMFEQDSERSVLIRGGTWIEIVITIFK